MITEKSIKILLCVVLIQSTIAAVFSYHYNNELKNDIKKNSKVIDSLNSEIFVRDIQLMRYDYVLDELDSITKERVDSVMGMTE